MKLRNKKTGRTHTLSEDLYIEYTQGGRIEARIVLNGGYMSYYYNSLAELNADWKDVEEPLIKDEKVRKFVRDWATFNKVETAYIKKTIGDKMGFEPSWFKITGRDGNGCLWSVEIHADYLETVSDGYDEETVPITELCGEEDE